MRTLCRTILAAIPACVASAAIDISTGRQLFVDDFLVEVTTNVVRNYTDDPAVLYRWRDEMADLIELAK